MANELRDLVRLIKDQTDIVDVVGRTVVLKKAGASYKGCCPFHKEKTPSFNVVPERRIFHCFGCGVGGSVIDFIMKLENLEFIEAVEKLAKELGLEMPSRRGFAPASQEDRDAESRLRQTVQAANDAALAWFRDNLLKGRNALANEYLPKRGLTDDLSERFQLGAALNDWDGLRNSLVKRGFSENLLVEAGLCVRSDRGSVYDRFRNRLIFPIFDANGRVAGFGGRQLDNDPNSPKYLNSAETVLYKKSQILYALNLAKDSIKETGYAVLCEGYMDVVMAHAHGFTQSVASLGTALTRAQSRLLKRYAGRTYFLYDGDSAGQKAMLRGGEPLLESDFDVRVISLPAEDDPDTFLRREGGTEELQGRIERAEEFFDFALRAHSSSLDVSKLAGQAELVERMAPVVVAMRNDVMREGAMLRLQNRLGGLPREAMNQILEKKRREAQRQQGLSDGREEVETPVRQEPGLRGAPPLDLLERNLFKVMIESADGLGLVRERLRQEWVTDERLQYWIFHLYDHHEYAETLIEEAQLDPEFPGDRSILSSTMAWEHPIGEDPRHTAEELLHRMHERHQLALTRQLLTMIDERLLQGDDAERVLMAYHNEHRTRIDQAGRFLRTRAAADRPKRPRGLTPPH